MTAKTKDTKKKDTKKKSAAAVKNVEVPVVDIPVQESPTESSTVPPTDAKIVTADVTVAELYKAFHKLNETYYDNSLPLPFIVILETGKKNAYGWFTPSKVWKDTSGEVEMHEIALSAEHMTRGTYLDIIETLHHEMIHLYCHTNDIKDTKKKGKYHNEAFKRESEARHLKVNQEADPKFGYAFTELTDELITKVESFGLDPEAFKLARAIRQKKKRKPNRSKYVCTSCEYTLRGKPNLRVTCGECGEELLELSL
jgi:hypothetical protein